MSQLNSLCIITAIDVCTFGAIWSPCKDWNRALRHDRHVTSLSRFSMHVLVITRTTGLAT
jgi:hypothetical protein